MPNEHSGISRRRLLRTASVGVPRRRRSGARVQHRQHPGCSVA